MSPFKAYLIDKADGGPCGRWSQLTEDSLDPGSVTIRVAYSSVNYKDALAATGKGAIVKRFPCVGGIDLSGTVLRSEDPRFQEGDRIIATSYDIGTGHHGGFAEMARLPGDWLVPLPTGLSLFEAMAIGTAGYTAALGVVRMEENGLHPANGRIVVSGATGGVGSLAIDILSGLGYAVVALTGKEDQQRYLQDLGAADIMLRSALDLSHVRPLERALWAGGVDNLGGDVLAWMASTMKQNGTIASVGLAASTALNTTVMPLILRGVSLLGVDSAYTAMPLRQRVWSRLAGDMRPRRLASITRTIEFDALADAFEEFVAARAHGRVVVSIHPEA